ncbi:MAG: NADH-quinone oxidoreductase subunit C, partial [Gammaproteobacteria bacterium]|nr:NADH-quinone oxidoreductase subunit C [Gammaproteobacteria bacterium]
MSDARLPVERLSIILGEVRDVGVSQRGPRRTRLDVAADALPALLELLKGRAGYVHLSAISCVDWPIDGQFELVYHLWSYELNA